MKLKKLTLKLLILSALAAGIIFLCGFEYRLPRGVTVNGIDVGTLTRPQAAKKIRAEIEAELKTKKLTVRGSRTYVFTYPEIGYHDDLFTLLKAAKKGSYRAKISYYLNGLNEILDYVCEGEKIEKVEPYALFSAKDAPFTYFEGNDGARADRAKLYADITRSLAGDFEEVTVEKTVVPRTKTMEEVMAQTALIGSFTTYFDGSNTARAHNISLAAQKINGTVIDSGGEFSFNLCVGERSVENGFMSAKIIENGEFVEGLGGGVCQASTTLYNAALLSGCKITEYHPHSLAVGYVPPSSDAMVSGSYFDLKFANTFEGAIYIRAQTGENFITFRIYGKGDGAIYSYSTSVTGSIPAQEQFTADISLARDGKDGVISEGYLTITRGDISVTKLVRRDRYAPVKRISYAPDPPAPDGYGNPPL